MRFTTSESISVAQPFRLDLTTDALRRLASNSVDVVDASGGYYRALPSGTSLEVVRVTQGSNAELELATTAKNARPLLEKVRTMLGLDVAMHDWDARSANIPWIGKLAASFRGVRPPRYASLWEACAHAIVFQQISIHAASSIMARLVSSLGTPLEVEGVRATAFPTPGSLLHASDDVLIAAGLSTNKRMHLRSVADAIESGEMTAEEIEKLSTSKASEKLVQMRGIGPWSAAVVLLRGFGRLDTFPMRDSGVARLVKDLSGDPKVDLDETLVTLGPVRGMLYYHLLLGRLRNLEA